MAFEGFSAMITYNNSTFLPAYLLNKEQINEKDEADPSTKEEEM